MYRNALVAIAMGLLLPASLYGQESAPAAGVAQKAPAAATEPTTALSLDTPVEKIAAEPAGRAVLDRNIPGLFEHPEYERFKDRSLRELAPMSGGALNEKMLTRAAADFAALPRPPASEQ